MVLRAPLADAQAGCGGEESRGCARADGSGDPRARVRRSRAAVTDDGGLLTWGERTHGQLGHGDRAASSGGGACSPSPDGWCRRRVWPLAHACMGRQRRAVRLGITRSASLASEMLLLRERGEALDAMNDALVPVALLLLFGADAGRAACGETHWLHAVGGAVLSWVSWTMAGRIAPLPDDIVGVDGVEGVPADPVQIACGDAFTAVLTASGELWAWGSNLDGRSSPPTTATTRRVAAKAAQRVGPQRRAPRVRHDAHGGARRSGALWVWGDRRRRRGARRCRGRPPTRAAAPRRRVAPPRREAAARWWRAAPGACWR